MINRKHQNVFTVFIAIVIVGMILLYFLYLRLKVIEAYQGTAPDWFNSLIEIFYPRFIIEKNRFDVAFFLNKADQVILRTSLAAILLTLFIYIRNTWELFQRRIDSFWNRTTSIENSTVLRILYFSLMLLIFKDIDNDLLELAKAKEFYRPVFLFNVLGIGFPSSSAILFIWLVLLISCIAALLNIFPVVAGTIAILDFIFIQGIIFSFEKTDHGFATFTYAGLVLPFLLHESRKAQRRNEALHTGWPLKLIQIMIAAGYLFSGLEKIFVSGFQWLHPDTFRNYLLLHNAPAGVWVAGNEFLCIALPLLTLCFQLGFILIVFYNRWIYIFIPAGILFHVITYYLFNVGGFLNPWIFAYIFFFDWTGIYRWVAGKLTVKS